MTKNEFNSRVETIINTAALGENGRIITRNQAISILYRSDQLYIDKSRRVYREVIKEKKRQIKVCYEQRQQKLNKDK